MSLEGKVTFDLYTFDWSAVVAICSFLALIGVIATLFEMRRQRRYTYRPLLAVEQKQFVIQNNDHGIPTIWKETYEHSKDSYQLPFYFKLHNIGFASAHDVQIHWKLDVSKLEDKLKKYLNPKQLTKIEHQGHPPNYFYHHNNGEFGFFLQGEDYF